MIVIAVTSLKSSVSELSLATVVHLEENARTYVSHDLVVQDFTTVVVRGSPNEFSLTVLVFVQGLAELCDLIGHVGDDKAHWV